MSSTVGYGFEVPSSFMKQFGRFTGELESLVTEKYEGLSVHSSKPEYGDDEKFFIMAAESVVQAGFDDAFAIVNVQPVEADSLDRFIENEELGMIYLSWYLVDSYSS